MSQAKSAERVVRDIRRKTRRRFSAEEKIRIVLEGLRGEESIAALCRREGLNPNLYYRWSKEFLEAGKKQLLGETTREATSTEVAIGEAFDPLDKGPCLRTRRAIYQKQLVVVPVGVIPVETQRSCLLLPADYRASRASASRTLAPRRMPPNE